MVKRSTPVYYTSEVLKTLEVYLFNFSQIFSLPWHPNPNKFERYFRSGINAGKLVKIGHSPATVTGYATTKTTVPILELEGVAARMIRESGYLPVPV